MLTIVKFFEHNNPKTENSLVTRSLGKLGFINRSWVPPLGVMEPRGGEIWMVDLVRELNPGRNSGCFLVDPIEPVTMKQTDEGPLVPDVSRLAPNLYDVLFSRGVLILTPSEQGPNWILSPMHRRQLLGQYEAHAIVVNLGGEPWNEG